MWLFSEKIVELMASTRFEMRIINHLSSRVSGRRVAFTTTTATALRAPLAPTQRADVEVEYTLDNNQVIELLPSTDLIPREAHSGCKHVVIHDCRLPQGTIVEISKLARVETRVVLPGKDKRQKSNIHMIPTSSLCPVVTIDIAPPAPPAPSNNN